MKTSENLRGCIGLALFAMVGCGGSFNLGGEVDAGGGGSAGAGGTSSTTSMDTVGTTGGSAGSTTMGSGGSSVAGSGGSSVAGAGGQGGTIVVVDDAAVDASIVVHCPNPLTPAVDSGPSEYDAHACACTRRPGPGTSFMCPAGTGKSATALIGPEGGTIELSGTPSTVGVPARLEIPFGALAAATLVSITETQCPPPSNFDDGSPIYQIDPPCVMLSQAAKLTIPYSVNSGVIAALEIWAVSDTGVSKVPDSYLNAGFL